MLKKIKLTDALGILGFVLWNFTILYLDKGIVPILLTVLGLFLFVYFIDKDVTSKKVKKYKI